MTLPLEADGSEERREGLPTLREAAWIWWRIGCLSFGGPAGQIALMHREVVETRRWIGERKFLHALNFCSLLPGPEAQQLATYLGWLMHGALGGWIAGLAFILPGALVMLILSAVYVTAGEVPIIAAIFYGVTCAVVAIVFDALRRVAGRALKGPLAWGLAGAAFVALFLFGVPFPTVVLTAAVIGFLLPGAFSAGHHGDANEDRASALEAAFAADPARNAKLAVGARRSGIIALVCWGLPVALLVPLSEFYGDIALFFSKMAVVTFGGAYAVLAYVAQEAVQEYGWLTPGEMLTGLGLAETTPGPLILVLQFVGYLAGQGISGALGAVLASVLTLWVTFAPCFAFVFLGAPYVERAQDNRFIAGALGGITAAVVGVIANLAVWFGLQVGFTERVAPPRGPGALELPVLSSVDPVAILIMGIAAVTLCRWRFSVVTVLGLCAGIGMGARLLS